MSSELPDCDDVFMMYFDRWYQPEERKRKIFKATRPDGILSNDKLRGLSPVEASPLTEDGQAKIKKLVNGMLEAVLIDWPYFLSVREPIDICWIDEFDKYYDANRVKALMESSSPDNFFNVFLVRCCEFGAALGHVLIKTQPNLHWVYDCPYWESSVFDPETGELFAVFHWAIKKFSNYGIDDGFRAKVLACAEIIRKERENILGSQKNI